MKTDLLVHNRWMNTDQAKLRLKEEYYLRIMQEEAKETQPSERLLFHLGKGYDAVDKPKEAVAVFEELLASGKATDDYIYPTFWMLVNACLRVPDKKRAQFWIKTGLSVFPKSPELLNMAAFQALEEGQLTTAERYSLQVLETEPESLPASIDLRMLTYFPYYCLGLIATKRGKAAEARSWLTKTLREYPEDLPAKEALKSLG